MKICFPVTTNSFPFSAILIFRTLSFFILCSRERCRGIEPPDDLPNRRFTIKQNRQQTSGDNLEMGQNCMSELLPKELEGVLPKIGGREGNKNPTVYAVFQFPFGGWAWFVTEGVTYGDDFCFFGYVVGLECEWGYFCLRELETVDIGGIGVCRDADHVPRPLSECLKQHGFAES